MRQHYPSTRTVVRPLQFHCNRVTIISLLVTLLLTGCTYSLGSGSGGAPLRWNTPSTNTPFLPKHRREKPFTSSYVSSKCRREIKLEWPMLMSTEPWDEFRPMVTVLLRMTNSKSRPSSLAKACGGGQASRTGRLLSASDGASITGGPKRANEGWW